MFLSPEEKSLGNLLRSAVSVRSHRLHQHVALTEYVINFNKVTVKPHLLDLREHRMKSHTQKLGAMLARKRCVVVVTEVIE